MSNPKEPFSRINKEPEKEYLYAEREARQKAGDLPSYSLIAQEDIKETIYDHLMQANNATEKLLFAYRATPHERRIASLLDQIEKAMAYVQHFAPN